MTIFLKKLINYLYTGDKLLFLFDSTAQAIDKTREFPVLSNSEVAVSFGENSTGIVLDVDTLKQNISNNQSIYKVFDNLADAVFYIDRAISKRTNIECIILDKDRKVLKHIINPVLVVNEALVDYFVFPLAGTADDDSLDDIYRHVDGNDEITIKQIISRNIKPKIESYPEELKILCKQSLSYYLTTGNINFERAFNAYLIAFNPPDDPKDFFIWVWQVMYPGEEYWMDVSDGIREKYDLDEPVRIIMENKKK